MRWFVFLSFLFSLYYTPVWSQQGSRVTAPYDSARAMVEQIVRERQDSIEREKLLQNIRKHGKTPGELLAGRKEQERKEKRRKWVRIGAGTIFMLVLLLTTARRYRQRKRH